MSRPFTDGIRILHVDDEPDFAELTATFLEREDERFTVETATSGSEGLDRLADADLDCIVSDYDMPGRNGIEFLEAVRADHPDLPFILFTGKGGEEVASDAISAGVTDYLRKEGNAEQYAILANRIRNAVERTRAERERRRQLDAIETVQEGIGILDEDGRFIYVNEAYADLYGYASEEMIGEHWELLYPDGNVARIRNEILPRVEETGYWHGRTTGLRADGSTFPEDHVLARTDRGELVCTVRDVTDREEHERKLEAERAFVEQALDVLQDVFYVLDTDGRLRRWNDRLTEVTGYTDEDVDGRRAADFFPEDQREAIFGAIEETLTTGRAVVEADLRTADGEHIPYEFTGTRLTDPEGDLIGLVGTGRDVSDRKRYRSALSALHTTAQTFMGVPDQRTVADHAVETARTVLHQPINGVWLYDADDDVLRPVAWTDEASDLFDDVPAYTGDSLSWKAFETNEMRVYDELRDEPDRLNPNTPIQSEIVLPLGEYGVMNIGSTESRSFDSIDVSLARILAGMVEAALSRADREQELRNRRNELERQNERLEEFASIVSHDLRNPLAVAEGRLDLARTECDSEHLRELERALDRMDALIDDVLTLAREGDRVNEMEPVDLAELAERCWGNVETGGATLVVDADRTVRADRSRLQQLLENLLRNSVEHGSTTPRSQTRADAVERGSTSPRSHAREDAVEHGSTSPGSQVHGDAAEHGSTSPHSQTHGDALERDHLTVTIGEFDDGTGFYVADDGRGIPEDERAEVFETGYSTSEDGTGFGLSIVEEIVEAHGWEITVTESEDGGARFEITEIQSDT